MKYTSKIALMMLLAVCGVVISSSQSKAQTAAAAQVGQPTAEAASTERFRVALDKHRPVLRFDSGEEFFPVRAEAITNHEGNRLVRDDGDLIKDRRNGRGLSIRYLRPGSYPTPDVHGNKEVRGSDRVNALGRKPGDFVGDDRRFQNTVYTRIFYLRDGSRITGAWLQYWFFYYYNDFPGFDSGDHEGDWEMVQIRVDEQARPIVAVYAAHKSGLAAKWEDVERTGTGKARPIVYVALGSHASYFHAKPCNQDRHIDGKKGLRIQRFVRLGSKSTRSWLAWPGHWGGSGESPQGPSRQGDKWDNPERFFRDALFKECVGL
jgi:hypothetical protein